MADQEESGERTEEATPQRREEFKKQGQVAMTKELGSALLLFGMSLALWLMGRFFSAEIVHMWKEILGNFAGTIGKSGDFVPVIKFVGIHTAMILGPILVITGVLAFAATTLQIGFLTNTEAISPNLDKINPINGFQRLFSMRSIVEGLKALIKVSLVGIISFLLVKSHFMEVPKLVDVSAEQLTIFMTSFAHRILFGIGLFMVVLAVLDYAYNYWDLEKRMRMTKQELKEEVKSREGNPQIKARIRRIQREYATKRMMEQVPKADVIITNPTHIAIALKYDANLPAPQVIAKGADLVAEKIKELAKLAGIPIVENKPLARAIFKTIKIGQVIPRELFHAVAEILAYVYKLKKKAVQ